MTTRDITAEQFNDTINDNEIVLVDFWASWCAPCRALMPVLDRIAADYAGRLVLAKLNVDEQQAIAARFGIRSIPTVLLFHQGRVVEQFTGVQPEADIRALLDRHVAADPGTDPGPGTADPLLRAHAQARDGDIAGATRTVEAALVAHPDQPALLAVLAGLQLSAHDSAGASASLGRLEAADSQFPSLGTLRTRLGFLAATAAWPDEAAAHAALEADPSHSAARHALAAYRAVEGDYAAALEAWLELLRLDRDHADGIARRSILAVFELLGGSDERVAPFRRRMASLLH